MHGTAASERLAACAIAVMAKASIAGRAKTRLVPPLTYNEAASLNTAFLRDVADNLLAAAKFANVSGWMAYAPVGSQAFFRAILPAGVGLIETIAPHFGECLFHAASSLLAAGYGAACVLNSDSPTLPVGYLVSAATALAAPGDRMVIGPSSDGGYYLLGIKEPHHRLFEDVDWSTDRVFGQTVQRAAEIGLPVVVLPTWYDVDDAPSVRRLIDELFHGEPFRREGTIPTSAPWTRRELVSMMQTGDLSDRLQLTPPLIRSA